MGDSFEYQAILISPAAPAMASSRVMEPLVPMPPAAASGSASPKKHSKKLSQMERWNPVNWVRGLRDSLVASATTMTPHSLAMAVAVGMSGGLFPIPGLTSVVTMTLGLLVGANLAAAQVVNVMSTPIEISFITLFLRLGELVMSVPNEQKMHIRKFPAAVQEDFSGALRQFRYALLYAAIGWSVAVVPIFLFGYTLARLVVRLFVKGARAMTKPSRE
mmetsp:Transcript_31314/g.55034  ORF Transcript_31314/g.55034 Transcript_31314/m.55034 type:complete len:218 (+) Transcript_31314:98-751(+)